MGAFGYPLNIQILELCNRQLYLENFKAEEKKCRIYFDLMTQEKAYFPPSGKYAFSYMAKRVIMDLKFMISRL